MAPSPSPSLAIVKVTPVPKVSRWQKIKTWSKKNRSMLIWRIVFFAALALIGFSIYHFWPRPDEFEKKIEQMDKAGYRDIYHGIIRSGNNLNLDLRYIGSFTAVVDTDVQVDTYLDDNLLARHKLVSGKNVEFDTVTNLNFLKPSQDIRVAILVNPK